MQTVILVGAGGFLGSVARYLVSLWATKTLGNAIPYGTLAVNVLGCFLIGFLTEHHLISLTPVVRSLLATGFLGGFTTFSAFSYETISMLTMGSRVTATLNILLNLILGLSMTLFGRILAQRLG